MHDLEPYYKWRNLYIAEEDARSPFFGRVYSEFEFMHKVYNYAIHPQWDAFGSETLYLKILYADYDKKYCIIELIGEWNDCLYNDIMFFKRDVIEHMIAQGINKFILLGDSVFNFHYSDDCYYEEWFEEVENGWVAGINFRDFVVKEFEKARVHYYIHMGNDFNDIFWQTMTPDKLYHTVLERLPKLIE